MHVLDLIYYLFQFFSVAPRFASSFRKLAPPSVSTSLKVIQKTYCTQSTRMNHGKNRVTSNQPGFFQLLQCLPWQCLAWRKAGQPLAGRGSDAGAPEPCGDRAPSPGGTATAPAQCPVPPTPPEGCKRCLAALIFPSQSLPTSIQPTPNMFCGSWPNILELHSHLQHFTTFPYFFSCFSVHAEIMKYNLYTRSILQLAYHEAASHTYLRNNVC